LAFRAAEDDDRLHVLVRVVLERFGVQHGRDAVQAARGAEQGVAVGRRFGERLEADRPARPGTVLHDEGLPELLRHLVHAGADDDVRSAAGAVGGNHPDRLGGIVLRRCDH
jgi:hypothetical protein